MKRIVLCNDSTCIPPKCPTVDVDGNKVIIGEKDGGPIVGTALADELGMDQGNLSRYLNQMAALNFLNKNRDGRIVSFEIKPELRLIFAEELGLTD